MGSNLEKEINKANPFGATPLSLEELEGLLPKFITTRQELYDAEFKNTSEALKKYFLSKRKYKFSIENFYKIHKEMFGKVWIWAGKKRKSNKNIGVDQIQIEIQLKILIGDFHYWCDQSFDIIEISGMLHSRLVYIHPFNNGNGRWARFIVNIFLRDNLNAYIDFPEDELALTTTIRIEYIKALQKADDLDYKPLIELHKKYLKNFD